MIGTLPPVFSEDNEQTHLDIDRLVDLYYDGRCDDEDDDVLIAEQYLDQL